MTICKKLSGTTISKKKKIYQEDKSGIRVVYSHVLITFSVYQNVFTFRGFCTGRDHARVPATKRPGGVFTAAS